MRIRVTKGDIEAGVQGNSFRCPVALAVRRAFKADTVLVREIIIVTKGEVTADVCGSARGRGFY